MTHTKGKWISSQKSMYWFVKPEDGHRKPICQMVFHDRAKPEDEANMKLIASAPELLEALKMMVTYTRRRNNFEELKEAYYKAEQAIKKAEG